MKLTELEGNFIRVGPLSDAGYGIAHVDTLAEAQGVEFLCPGCWRTNGGARGTHIVICWFADRDVPADAVPLPGRWGFTGTGLDDLTLIPSVNVGMATAEHPEWNCWHGFIQNGSAT